MEGYKFAHDQQDGNQVALTCILSPTFLRGDAKGNVHSGAPPPWLEMDQEKGGILSGKNGLSTDIQRLSKNQEIKLQKLRNPKRVGATWEEQRRAELEREINGETSSKNITNDVAWLPSFGRVWQSGSRKDSRKEFEVEKSIESSSLTKRENLVEVQPYINKRMVDRCVTDLVAHQQTVSPLQLPLTDVAVIAQTYTGLSGGACAIGEQPIKGLLNPKEMARLAVGEGLTNIVWAKVTSLNDVKASGNWMYAAKLDGEGASMYDADNALQDAMIELGIAIDAGKDSLSMAAQAGGETVKAGNLVIGAYVTYLDISKTVTLDLKLGDDVLLLHIDLAKGKHCLGGSALAHVFDQLGDVCPDLDDVSYLKRAFNAVESLLDGTE